MKLNLEQLQTKYSKDNEAYNNIQNEYKELAKLREWVKDRTNLTLTK